MNPRTWFRTICALLPSLAATLFAAGQTASDSLYSPQFGRWPEKTQRRLIQPVSPRASMPRIEQLAHSPAVPPLIRGRMLVSLGRAYFRDLQPNVARMRLLEARQLSQPHHDSAVYCDASTELCYISQSLQQPRQGIVYGEEAIRMAPRARWRSRVSNAYTMLGACAHMLRNYPLARRYYAASLRINWPQQGWENRLVEYVNLAGIHLELHQNRLASQYLDSVAACLPHIREQQDSVSQVLVMYWQQLRADVARHQGRPAEAVTILEPQIRLVRQRRLRVEEQELIRSLKPALVQLGRYREALAYQDRYIELLDTMYEQTASRQAQELQVLYETQRKEQQLSRQRRHIDELSAQARLREARSRQQRLLFGATLAGALLMLGGVVAYQRARHLLATRAAAQQMRTRIAADLHDEVGTLLTRVSMQADMLRQLQPEPSPALDRLLSNSRQAAGIMRDIVWGIDAQADTATALLDRMREFLHQSAAPAGLEVELQTDNWPEAETLPQLLRQQVYLVFKEAVTNAVKHARGATVLRVRLRRAAGHLRLTVADDGPPTPVGGPVTGLGLRSMRQRAESVGGTLTAGPRPEGGFQVTLDAPLQYD